MSPTRPYAVLGLGLLAVSTAVLFIRFAQAEAVPSLAIAAVRLTLATLILAPAALRQHRATIRALPGRTWGLIVISGVFLGLHFATWITSLRYTTITNSTVFVSSSPIFVALIARAFLGETIRRSTLIGLVITVAGSVVIAFSDACGWGTGCRPLAESLQGGTLLGDGLALAGAAAVAVYLVIGRRLRQGLDLVPYITLTYGAAALSLLAACLVTGTPVLGYSGPAYLWLVLLALVPQTIGHTSFNWALKHLPATFVSVATLGEPILSSLLALLVLHEAPTPLKVVGGAVVLVGIAVTLMVSGEARRAPVAPLQTGPDGASEP